MCVHSELALILKLLMLLYYICLFLHAFLSFAIFVAVAAFSLSLSLSIHFYLKSLMNYQLSLIILDRLWWLVFFFVFIGNDLMQHNGIISLSIHILQYQQYNCLKSEFTPSHSLSLCCSQFSFIHCRQRHTESFPLIHSWFLFSFKIYN